MGYENISVYASEEGLSVLEVYKFDNGSLTMEFVRDPRDTLMYG